MIKPKKTAVVVTLLILVVALGGGSWVWLSHGTAAADSADKGESAQESVSALVKTQKIEQTTQRVTLQVFGDVTNGKIISLSFAQAGQVSVLSVLAGQQVHQGDTLALLTSDPNAIAAFAQATSAASFAHAEVQRAEELFALNMLTQTQLDTAHKQLQDAQALLTAQKKMGGATDTIKLSAPQDGVVVLLTAAQGDRVTAGAPILQLGDSKSLRIQLGIEPGQRQLVHIGMQVALSTLQDPTQTVRAKIAEVQNVIDPKTQLINATVLLPAASAGAIVAGMRVQGVIELGQQQVWLVPRQAVLNDAQGDYLFQTSAGKAHRIEVSKTMETPTHVGVRGAIHPDWPLVVLGNYELDDAMAVRESAQ